MVKEKVNKIKALKKKIKELESIIALAMNKGLIKELTEEIKRIEQGEFYTEEEFTRKHHLVPA